jgi:NAD(P)-dependent dehydrogenase (short-subunit alcohol dehydrogenase family)
MAKIALVTGGNRGLGLETARQLASLGLRVVLTARDEAKAREAARELGRQKLEVIPHALDVTREDSMVALQKWVESELGQIDVLVNNAGVFLESSDSRGDADPSIFEIPVDVVRRTLETNTFGAYRLCQLFVPPMLNRGWGRVVNVSSGMGQLAEMNGGYPGYRISKTALNAITRIVADETQGKGVLVNSVCPGWVKTDMGGPNAERSIPEGADTIVWLATLPDSGPTGGFFRDRKKIDW